MLINIIILFIFIAGVMGCSTAMDRVSSTNSNENISQEQSTQVIPSDSLFSKIQIAMGHKQVTDLIGHPSDYQMGSTGKTWIPFYFGSDRVRTVYYYKGEGRLFFSGSGRVIKIDYDSSEDGYK